ncbi:MAG: histidine phosphatase family protein [Mycobacteriales bacterium]
MTAVRRVLLVRHAGTAATRHGDVAADEPLTDAGRRAAAQLRSLVPGGGVAVCSPTARARETAVAAGWPAVDEPRLGPLDLGLWGSKSLQEIGGMDPAGLVRWLSDPSARPHGGETVLELIERVRNTLAAWHEPGAGDLVAVTHAAIVRAAVVVAMGAPAESFWRVDVTPSSVTELHTRGSGWVLVRTNVTSA